jgi:Peptidase family M23
VSTGTTVKSMWGGTVVEAAYPTSFGSAFGRAVVIDHDKLPDGSPGGWGIYCHLSEEQVSVGQRVEAGTVIGKAGNTGNVTGPHLHVGVYMAPYWSSGGGVDPQDWLDAGGGGGGGSSEYPTPTSKTVHLSKLHYGQEDSDSVWYLQDALNAHPLSGGATIPTTGGYFDLTDAEVIKCQSQHGFGADPAGHSFVGPSQANHIFAGRGVTILDD